MAQIDSFEARYVVLQSIFSGYLAAPGLGSNMQVFQVWIAGQLQQALDEVRQVDENDGALIVDIATKYSPEFFAHRYAMLL